MEQTDSQMEKKSDNTTQNSNDTLSTKVPVCGLDEYFPKSPTDRTCRDMPDYWNGLSSALLTFMAMLSAEKGFWMK